MSRTIQIKRGLKADLPALAVGELGFTIDTHEVFIGSAAGNVPVESKESSDLLVQLEASNADIQSNITQLNNEVLSMSRGLGQSIQSMALLNSTYPAGDTKDHIVSGNVKELVTLTVTAIPSVSANVTITLDGIAATLLANPSIHITTAALASAIRSQVFAGWVTGGTGSVVTFEAAAIGPKGTHSFSGGTSGAAGSVVTTREGESANFHRYFWSGTAWLDGGVDFFTQEYKEAIEAQVLADFTASENARQSDYAAAEAIRQADYVEASNAAAANQELYDGLLEEGVLQTSINTKLAALELEYAPELTTLQQSDVTLSQQLAEIAVDVASFGAIGDGINDDTSAITNALNFAVANNANLLNQKNKKYKVTSKIEIDTSNLNRLTWDLNGSTIEISSGGSINIGTSTPIPYLTTFVTSDLVKGKTKFTISDVTGISSGDLIEISSPVIITTGVNITQFYVVGEVDVATKEIFVEGMIVGDISEKQKVDSSTVGDIVVRLYKLAKNIKIKNGSLISEDRDNGDTLLYLKQAHNFVIENIKTYDSQRNGIYISYCGSGEVLNCTFKDYGYTSKDQGYVNEPTSPGGISFGYGLIMAKNYFVHVINCHSYSGWHGFEASNGQTLAIYEGCVSFKDAYGFSTHEGTWDIRYINCHIEGGLGIFNRGMMLTVIGCVIKPNLYHAISGYGSYQTVIIKDNYIEICGTKGAFFRIGSGLPSYLYSVEKPVSIVSGNELINGKTSSQLYSLGEIFFTNNMLKASVGNDATMEFKPSLSGSKIVNLANNVVDGIPYQSVFKVYCDTLYAKCNVAKGSVGLTGGSAFIYAYDILTAFLMDNDVFCGNYLIRYLSNAGSTSVVKILKNNLFNGQYIVSNANVGTAINNVSTSDIFVNAGTVNKVVNHAVIPLI